MFNQQLFDNALSARDAAENFAGKMTTGEIEDNDTNYVTYLELAKKADKEIRKNIKVNGGQPILQQFPIANGLIELAINWR